MDSNEDSTVFAPATHPLSFPARDAEGAVYNVPPPPSSEDTSRSFEMMAAANAGSCENSMRITTTVPSLERTAPSPTRSRNTASVHIDPHRSATVAAAAAAKKKAEEEAKAEPVTAENETWGHWSFRHAYNSIVMVLISFYQVCQVGIKQQPVDMKTISYTNSVYMPAPPHEEELKKQKEAAEKATEAP